MKLKVDDIQFNILLNESDLSKNKTPIVLLHGFTGRAKDWQFLFDKLPQKFFPIAIDLIGHGETDSPENQKYYTCNAMVHQIDSIISQLGIEKFMITGYSMGGRAALSYSFKHSEKIIAAILESTTAGIEDMYEIKKRVELDLLLSDKIKNEGIESFTDFWFDAPLFASLKNLPNFEQIKKDRNQNNITGLSNMLLSFSTGLMPSYWDRLHTLVFPILLISGKWDEKYTNLNNFMQLKFPNAQHHYIDECGHNVHLEKPQLFTKLVVHFLNSI
jgi:2-succinyl-6-hydroxy-2,4-cyclohexadiene-1-carboxylate synthase